MYNEGMVGHESGTHTHGQGKLYMPSHHFMAGCNKKHKLSIPQPKDATDVIWA